MSLQFLIDTYYFRKVRLVMSVWRMLLGHIRLRFLSLNQYRFGLGASELMFMIVFFRYSKLGACVSEPSFKKCGLEKFVWDPLLSNDCWATWELDRLVENISLRNGSS